MRSMTAVIPPILREAARRPDADQRTTTEVSEKTGSNWMVFPLRSNRGLEETRRSKSAWVIRGQMAIRPGLHCRQRE